MTIKPVPNHLVEPLNQLVYDAHRGGIEEETYTAGYCISPESPNLKAYKVTVTVTKVKNR